MTAEKTWLERYDDERIREYEERIRLRGLKRAVSRQGLGRGGRCPNHGGASTGPKTPEGRQRIAGAQRRHWAR